MALTQSLLKELLHYDPETGVFTWERRGHSTFATIGAAKSWNIKYPGTAAGSINSDGYIGIGIKWKIYKAHRLVWLYVHGQWPEDQIDHINHDRADNRLLNLREVTPQENSQNRKPDSLNTSGIVGVCFHKAAKKWYSQININKRCTYLGVFDDFDDAVKARKEAEVKYGYHENHGK